jgi:hypothetical protein
MGTTSVTGVTGELVINNTCQLAGGVVRLVEVNTV